MCALTDDRYRMVASIQTCSKNQEVPLLDDTTLDMGGDGANNESISHPIANLIGRMKPTQGEKDGWGTPFPIEWICTEPLSFTRIQYIHNAWNNDVSYLSTALSPISASSLSLLGCSVKPKRQETVKSCHRTVDAY
jgi:hypothetical protein